MLEFKLKEIADNADMVVAGYSFTKGDDGFIRILNLNNPEQACMYMPVMRDLQRQARQSYS